MIYADRRPCRVRAGEVEITQGGRTVALGESRGPIRIRRPVDPPHPPAASTGPVVDGLPRGAPVPCAEPARIALYERRRVYCCDFCGGRA
ncbi:DUF3253 domain-containing protein [Streptomyces sp. NPDC101158]|uniref:DUF3253 domain-containing protein n=1 Tax=Streptomyces sp. NPDC101158 TaxID=3366117 RepID=UPI0037FA400B